MDIRTAEEMMRGAIPAGTDQIESAAAFLGMVKVEDADEIELDAFAEFEAIQAEIYADLDERARHLAAADAPTMPDDPSEQFAFATCDRCRFPKADHNADGSCPVDEFGRWVSPVEIILDTVIASHARPYGYDGGRCVECGATDGGHYLNCEAVN